MKSYRVYVGYPGNKGGCGCITTIQATGKITAGHIAYGVWLGWGLYNGLDQSNYYIEEVEDE